ncbi:MAG: hypothetical protein QM722_07445 [Piscinibacter sp.]
MTTMRGGPLLVLALASTAMAAAASAEAPPPGRYEGRWCVAVGEATADCGAAQVDVLRPRRLNVRISDIVYQLTLNSSQLDVVLMHGTMQIDGFFASYEWDDGVLQFLDVDKRTRYELRLPPRPR